MPSIYLISQASLLVVSTCILMMIFFYTIEEDLLEILRTGYLLVLFFIVLPSVIYFTSLKKIVQSERLGKEIDTFARKEESVDTLILI